MNKYMYLLLLVIIAATLAGCSTTLAPDYTRPAAPVPTNWPSGPAYQEMKAATTNNAENIPWRDFYIDAKLRKIIELALANNRDLRVAAMTIEKTRAMYRIQRADLLPTINAVGYGTKQEIFANVASFEEKMKVEYYSVNMGFSSYELDLFGRIRSLKERALQQYLATAQAHRSLQISLIAEIAGVYLNLAADHERLRLSQNTLDSQETSYDLIQRRYETGEISELDLRQAQTSVEAARTDAAKYLGQVAVDENTLNLLSGAQVPRELLPGELGEITALKDISTGLPSEILLRRPDILQAENQLQAANANIGAARAAFFPSITLTGNYGTMDDQLGGLFKSGSGVWQFTPQITVPIFDTGRNWAGLDSAKADREIYLARYEKTIQTAFREVADALAQRGTLQDQLKAQESLVDATAAAYSLAGARYDNGIDSYLAVLDSQRSLYTAQQGLIAVRLAGLANLVTLYKALGGG